MARNAVKLGSRKSGWWEYVPVLREYKPFDTSGSLKGRVGDDDYSWGRLTDDELAAFKDAYYARKLQYVVYSYSTPIAWKSSDDAEWYVSESHYSETTTKQQNKIAVAISKIDDPAY